MPEGNDPRRYYNAKPYSEDPALHVPTAVPGEIALPRLAPVDAPAQSRPEDWRSNGRPRLRFFRPVEFSILAALAEALIAPPEGQQPALRPEEIALNVDRYLGASRSPMRVQIRLGLRVLNLLSLASGKPPFRFMGASARRAWCRRFTTNRGLLVPKVAKLKSLVYLGYYTDPRSDEQTGYETVLERNTPLFRETRRYYHIHVWQGPAAAAKQE